MDLKVDQYELKKFMDAVPRIEETVNKIFKRLFVEDPENGDKCALVVEVRKNTSYRKEREEVDSSKRKNKWRRRTFYLAVTGFILTNLIILYKLFVSGG